MPPARASAAPSRRTRQAKPGATGPRRIVARAPRVRVRWERLGRIGLLLVLAVVIGLYAQHTLSYLHARGQADRQQTVVAALQRQNRQLTGEQRSLSNPATIVTDARRLGMIRPGEMPYVITGSPSR
ncbi:MAG: FtsB family cell division protein [Solirubrobacteraceae bacterium]